MWNPHWTPRTGAPAAPQVSLPEKEEVEEVRSEPDHPKEAFLTQQEAEEEVEEEAAAARSGWQLVGKPSRDESRSTSGKKNKKNNKKDKKEKEGRRSDRRTKTRSKTRSPTKEKKEAAEESSEEETVIRIKTVKKKPKNNQ